MILKTKIAFTLILVILSPAYAQNQTLLAIPYAAKNLVRDSFVSPIRRAMANLRIKKMNEEDSVVCQQDIINNKHEVNNLEEFITEYNNICRPWSEDQRCDCNLRCPEDFSIITSPFYKGTEVMPEDDLAFRNDPDDFENTKHKMTGGYCWGHAVGTQNFSRLAVFDKDQKLVNSEGKEINTRTPAYEEEIKKRIKRILRNQVAELPGFANLRELSSTAPFDKFIKEEIAKTWANKAMSFNGVAAALNSNVDAKNIIEKRLQKIKERLNLGLSSQLIFTAETFKFFTHAVLVQNAFEDPVTGDTVLCIQDSNVQIEENSNCQNQMRFKLQNDSYKIEYSDWKFLREGAIGGVHLNPDEDYDTLKQIKSLRRYCQKIMCANS